MLVNHVAAVNAGLLPVCPENGCPAGKIPFFLDLKQNARGKVVRITEKVSSNRDRIMVPAEILDDFIAALQDIRETLKQQGE